MTLAVDRFRTRYGLAIGILAPGPGGANFFVLGSNAVLGATTAIASQAMPALDFTGSWLDQGSPGAEFGEQELTFRIAHRRIVSGTSPMLPAEAMRASYWIGATVLVYAAAYDGSAWSEELLGTGTLVDSEVGEDGMDVRVTMSSWKNRQAPLIQVASNSMTWGADEGSLPSRATGAPFPFFYGKFMPDARLPSITTSHPFSRQAGGAYVAGLFGYKYPMIPLKLVADKYVKPSGSAIANTARLALLGTGDTNIGMTVTTTPGLGGQGLEPRGEDYYCEPIWTWDGGLNQGTCFIKDMGSVLDVSPTLAQKPWNSAGDWLAEQGAHTTATAANSKFHPFYIARTSPEWGTADPVYWMGPSQAVVVKAIASGRPSGTVNGVNFSTVGPPTNVAAILSPDFTSYCSIANGQRLCLDFQPTGPGLGDIQAILVGVSNDPAGTSNDIRFAMCRYGSSLTNRICDLRIFYETARPASSIMQLTASKPNHLAMFIPPSRQTGAAEGPMSDWNFWNVDAAGSKFPWQIVIWPNDSGTARIYAVWLQIIYSVDIGERVDGVKFAEFRTAWSPPANRGRGGMRRPHRPVPLAYTLGRETKPLSDFSAWTHGKGPMEEEETEGRYFGVVGDTLENPAQIALHYVDKFHGEYALAVTAGNTFGSFYDVFDALGGSDFPLVVAQDSYTPSESFLAQLGSHCKSFVIRHQGATPAWRMFLDTPTVATDFPERLYKTDGRYFGINEIVPGSFKARPSSWHSIRNQFVLKYGWHAPTSSCVLQKTLSASATDLASDALAYKSLCSTSQTRYGSERPVEIIELPWIWRDDVADEMLKWYADTLANPRITVKFTAYFRAYDIMSGHVIRVADEIGDRVQYPGFLGTSNWSDHDFNVLQAERVGEANGFILVEIEAVETYTAAA